MVEDIAITVDCRLADHAREWTESAMSMRPWRAEFFDAFDSVINGAASSNSSRVLELGSGPGFLAEKLLAANPALVYVALDFSAPMHELAKRRLGTLANRVRLAERSLREPHWSEGLGQFDFAVTHQAVHELRQERYAAPRHAQVRQLLLPGGGDPVCDHYFGEGGMPHAHSV